MKKILMILILILSVVFVAGIALASIPGPDGVIHGCYKTSNPAVGTVIVIDSAASCPSGFAALNWNQIGPLGPQGPAGPQGDPGQQRYYEAPMQHEVMIPGGTFNALLECDDGDIAVSGGYYFGGHTGTGYVAADHPVYGGPVQTKQWFVQIRSTDTDPADAYAFARCADLFPYRS